MSNVLSIRNRQRNRPVNVPLLRRLLQHLLRDQFGADDFEIGVHLVNATEMARLNEKFLRHQGSTDVITFDHSTGTEEPGLRGEIFISIPDAVTQARQFRTTWPSELARYAIHGLLHLRGYDDLDPARRRAMKREENRFLRSLAARFPLAQLGWRSRVPARRSTHH